jgi:hypothetical protein
MTTEITNETTTDAAKAEDWAELIRKRINGLRFGSLEITVHESRIVQIELSERSRVGRDVVGRRLARAAR